MSAPPPLWLCLEFPELALERLRGPEPTRPRALTRLEAGRRRLVMVDEAARRRGLRPGLGLAAALAAVPELVHRPYEAPAERAALERLAGWAYGYSARVVLCPPRALALEIGASLALFGGALGLRRRLDADLTALDMVVQRAVAPTVRGAEWLARHDPGRWCADAASLARRLRPLPVDAALDGDRDGRILCAALNLHTLGELWRLPRTGLVRRWGPALLERLDQALGRAPDPRPGFTPPPRFEATVELPAPVDDAAALVFAARRLLDELALVLRARQRGVQTLRLRLAHAGGGSAEIELRLLAAGRDAAHWSELLRTRLERLQLAEPVTAVTLSADQWVALTERSAELFAPRGDGERIALLERLRERLGDAAIVRPALHADHRPERALRWLAPTESATEGTPPRAPRPLWLLDPPRALARGPDADWRLSAAERIESGWWDGADTARDYYVARRPDGRRLWLYRERRPPGRWYVHGLFG